jgi:hypothetical protein
VAICWKSSYDEQTPDGEKPGSGKDMTMKLTGSGTTALLTILLAILLIGTAQAAENRKLAEPAVFSSHFRPFSATSPWNTPVPTNAVVDPDSGAMITMLNIGRQHQEMVGSSLHH